MLEPGHERAWQVNPEGEHERKMREEWRIGGADRRRAAASLAEGKTVHEAFSNLEHAAKSWIEAAEEAGQEIPEPSTNAGFGGKVALRLPRSLHKQAVRMAERDGTSLNQFLVMSIAGRVGSEDFYTKLVNRLESRFLAVAANVMTRMVINYYLQQPGARLETLNDKLLQTANTRAKQEVVTADGRS